MLVNLSIIPSYIFNNQLVFISNNSFKQNKSVDKDIRKYINESITFNSITTIGGEAYLIGLTNNKIKNIINYTNSKAIYNDANFNNKFYKKINENNLIDYNICSQIKTSDLLIINLAKLNQNLMKVINNSNFKEIIIIISRFHILYHLPLIVERKDKITLELSHQCEYHYQILVLFS